MFRSFDTDVLIVGGGPAGLAAALAARRKGFRVLVADCARPPVDKPCGEGLMPDGRAALARLGVSLRDAESFPFRGIRFLDGGASAAAPFPGSSALGIRRAELHRVLIEHAAAAGVSMRWGAQVSAISENGVLLDGRIVRCDWVVGADGGNSAVRRWAALDASTRNQTRFGFRRRYAVAPWTDFMELYWGARCQIYVTPVAPREICVVVVSRDSHLRLDQALMEFPLLSSRLSLENAASPERGAVSAWRTLKAVYRGRVVLIGDASGSVDAVTGEGLCLAFQQALALGEALEQGDLARYQAEHRRIARLPALMSGLLLSLEHRAWLRRGILQAFAAKPGWFEKMLAMHVSALPRWISDFEQPVA